jgi:excisionase family DNA binding protein
MPPKFAHILLRALDFNGENETMLTLPSIEEPAKRLKIGKPTLHQMARDGKVPAQKLGRAWRLSVKDLDRWLKSGGQASESPMKV